MKKSTFWLMTILLFLVGMVLAETTANAQAPIPLTINSREPSAPAIDPYQASRTIYRVSFVDGTNRVDLTGKSGWMSWATNSYAGGISTANVSVVSNQGGIVDFTFTAQALNPTGGPGRYIYEAGVRGSAGITVYRQGILTLRGSPYAVGVASTIWSTNRVNWGAITWTGLPTTMAGYGIVDGIDLVNLIGVSTLVVTAQGEIDAHEALKGTNVHGLGTAATNPVAFYATAAQGLLAASAVQTETDTVAIAQITSHAALSGTNAHGLGSASTSAASAFATSAQGALAATAVQTETDTVAIAQLGFHTNLFALSAHPGLGTAATNPTAYYPRASAFNAVSGEFASASASLIVVSSRVDAISSSVVKISSGANVVSARVDQVIIHAGVVSSRVDSVSGQVVLAVGHLNIISGRVDSISGQVVKAISAANVVSSRVDSISGVVDQVISAAGIVSGRVDSISGTVDIVIGHLGVVSGRVNSVSSDVAKVISAANIVSSRVDAVSGSVAVVIGRVNVISGRVDAVSNDLLKTISNVAAISNMAAGKVGSNSTEYLLVSSNAVLGSVAYNYGDHAQAGYLTVGTSRFDNIYALNRSKVSTNLCNLTSAMIGNIASVVFTGSADIVRGRSYMWGFTKQNAFGTSELWTASQVLRATGSGAISNWFVALTNDTVVYLRLYGDSSSKSDVTNVFIRQSTNGILAVAENLYVGGDVYLGQTNSIWFPDGRRISSLLVDAWNLAYTNAAAYTGSVAGSVVVSNLAVALQSAQASTSNRAVAVEGALPGISNKLDSAVEALSGTSNKVDAGLTAMASTSNRAVAVENALPGISNGLDSAVAALSGTSNKVDAGLTAQTAISNLAVALQVAQEPTSNRAVAVEVALWGTSNKLDAGLTAQTTISNRFNILSNDVAGMVSGDNWASNWSGFAATQIVYAYTSVWVDVTTNYAPTNNLVVTGALGPDATGDYTPAALYGGYNSWTNGVYQIRYESVLSAYVIHSTAPADHFQNSVAGLVATGTYNALSGQGTGTATVVYGDPIITSATNRVWWTLGVDPLLTNQFQVAYCGTNLFTVTPTGGVFSVPIFGDGSGITGAGTFDALALSNHLYWTVSDGTNTTADIATNGNERIIRFHTISGAPDLTSPLNVVSQRVDSVSQQVANAISAGIVVSQQVAALSNVVDQKVGTNSAGDVNMYGGDVTNISLLQAASATVGTLAITNAGATNGAIWTGTDTVGNATWVYPPIAVAWPTVARACPANNYTPITNDAGSFGGDIGLINGFINLKKVGWWMLGGLGTARGTHAANQLVFQLFVNNASIDRVDDTGTENRLPEMSTPYYNSSETTLFWLVQGYYAPITNEPGQAYTHTWAQYLHP